MASGGEGAVLATQKFKISLVLSILTLHFVYLTQIFRSNYTFICTITAIFNEAEFANITELQRSF